MTNSVEKYFGPDKKVKVCFVIIAFKTISGKRSDFDTKIAEIEKKHGCSIIVILAEDFKNMHSPTLMNLAQFVYQERLQGDMKPRDEGHGL